MAFFCHFSIPFQFPWAGKKSKSDKITKIIFNTSIEDASKKSWAISMDISISLSFSPKFKLKFDHIFII